MGLSTVTCRVRDESGREFDYTFVVSNQSSDGNITEDEVRMAVQELARLGLPEGTTLVSDQFTLREGTCEGTWWQRHFGSASVQTLTGVAQLFRPREIPHVVTIAPVTITGDAAPEIPTVRVEDLPQVDARGKRISTVRVEDLPVAEIPTVRIEDLPRA